MNARPPHRLLFVSAAAATFTTLLSLLLSLLANDNQLKKWLADYGVETWRLAGAAIGALIVSWLLHNLQHKYVQPAESRRNSKDFEPDVKEFVDSLTERYERRLRGKMDGRFEITLEADENFDSPNSDSSEQIVNSAPQKEAGKVIRKAFDQRGRLLIVGNSGVGKTVLLLRLAIELLDNIQDLEKEAFPVIFDLALWSDEYQDFGNWLKAMLVSQYNIPNQLAETLLVQERIVFLLDGLDELGRDEWWARNELHAYEEQMLPDYLSLKREASSARAACMKSLNDYLRGSRRVVISCRLEEFEELKKKEQDVPVSIKIRIPNLSNDQVLKALKQAANAKDHRHHASAHNLLRIAEGHDKLLEVLSVPFYYTIAMEVLDQTILSENNLPESVDELRVHLIEQFVGQNSRAEARLRTSK